MSSMKRRDFIKSFGAWTASFALGSSLFGKNSRRDSASAKKPNILFIFTDQQTLNAMSASGNPYLETPAMDSIAANGVRFENSYCTSPVCSPARSSLLTGAMPHETGVNYNDRTPPDPSIPNMGEIFRQAGYKTVWVGKWHLPAYYLPGNAKEIPGFELLEVKGTPDCILGDNTDGPVADAAVDFIKSKHEQPFLLGVSLLNPHDICYYIMKPESYPKPRSIDDTPPLPANFAVDPDEPEFMKKRRKQAHYGSEVALTADWAEKDWRAYLYSYYRMTERVDAEVGKVLNALKEAGLEENTLIIFTSDHGEGMAAHKWVVKLCLYEEAVTVPMIVSFKGVTPAGRADRGHLVSGLDVLPTMCDYAAIRAPANFRGRSLRTIIENPKAQWRDFVVSELATDKKNHDSKARMLRTSQYKYIAFSYGRNNEQLFDLKNDPGETKNLASDSSMKPVLNQHRDLLGKWIVETGDSFNVPGQQFGGKKMEIKITSPAFADGGLIPAKYTCDGADISPPLRWEAVPEGTNSIALICDDPDAPMGTFVHWVLFNLPAETKELAENIPTDETLPDGARQGISDFSSTGYGGPCPPSGTHRYLFKIYALDMKIDMVAIAGKSELLKAMEGHILGQGQLVGRYKRQ